MAKYIFIGAEKLVDFYRTRGKNLMYHIGNNQDENMAEIKREMRDIKLASIAGLPIAAQQTYILEIDDFGRHVIYIAGQDTTYILLKKGDEYIKSPYNEYK